MKLTSINRLMLWMCYMLQLLLLCQAVPGLGRAIDPREVFEGTETV